MRLAEHAIGDAGNEARVEGGVGRSAEKNHVCRVMFGIGKDGFRGLTVCNFARSMSFPEGLEGQQIFQHSTGVPSGRESGRVLGNGILQHVEQGNVGAAFFGNGQGEFGNPGGSVVERGGKDDARMTLRGGVAGDSLGTDSEHGNINLMEQRFGDRAQDVVMVLGFSMGAGDEAVGFPFGGGGENFLDRMAGGQMKGALNAFGIGDGDDIA